MQTMTWRSRRLVQSLAVVAAGVLSSSILYAENVNTVLYRVVLADGTALASYGEWARVGDKVVFSMPLGAVGPAPTLHLVSIPSATVDWPATDQYAESARSSQYAATRGETDFALMTSDVARALNEIALTDNAARRLEIALQARRTVTEWPLAHFGYRAGELRQVAGLLDEVVSGLRAGMGEQRFDLSFVATAELVAPVPLLPPPTLQESIAQVLTVARTTDEPAERLSLLRSAITLMDDTTSVLPSAWKTGTRALASSLLTAELKVERSYSDLTRQTIAAASVRAARSDVRGIEAVIRRVVKRDNELGQHRPQEMGALLDAVRAKLDAARRLRLARDLWASHAASYQRYRRAIRMPLDEFGRVATLLDDLRTLAGPDDTRLTSLEARAARVMRQLAGVTPPAELQSAHALLTSAWQLAGNAARIRRQAVATSNLQTAWDASSAAAGSVMLAGRARDEMERLLKMPELR